MIHVLAQDIPVKAKIPYVLFMAHVYGCSPVWWLQWRVAPNVNVNQAAFTLCRRYWRVQSVGSSPAHSRSGLDLMRMAAGQPATAIPQRTLV